MRTKEEIGRFSLQPSEKITVEELEEFVTEGCDIYHVYLIGNMGYVRDQAQMLYDPDEEEAIISWNGETEKGEAEDPEKAAIQWIDDELASNGKEE